MKVVHASMTDRNAETPLYLERIPTASEGRRASLLQQLLDLHLVRECDWASLPDGIQSELLREGSHRRLLTELVRNKLLTDYQADRIEAGTTHGLIFGNYRVLSRLGSGGMGVVFKGQHLYLPRTVAIKVLPASAYADDRMIRRFRSEIAAIAQLHHPNIVSAIDAGELPAKDGGSATHYLVMEFINGESLEDKVERQGPLSVVTACDLIYQVASALAHAAKHDLVHRDIKPSNVLVTPEGRAILLDFGLALCSDHRLTEPGTMLGTPDFMAPEQATDARRADVRSDIYALGGTLFWCLTGRTPFDSKGDLVADIHHRMTQPPPLARALQPSIPAELDATISCMMALNPDDRFATLDEVMNAIVPFLKSVPDQSTSLSLSKTWTPDMSISGKRTCRVLVVDDEAPARTLCRYALQASGIECAEAEDGFEALELLRREAFDLVLCDVQIPSISGAALLQAVRSNPPAPHMKFVMFSGQLSADEMSELMNAGADDCILKPITASQLVARVRASLRLRDAQLRSDYLKANLLEVNATLEQTLASCAKDLTLARAAFSYGLGLVALQRGRNSGSPADLELDRLRKCCRHMSEKAVAAGLIDSAPAGFTDLMEAAVCLRDIGMASLPDSLQFKHDGFTIDDRRIMQSHTGSGMAILDAISHRFPFSPEFLKLAADVVRHHHERFDGTGYPDKLKGAEIPVAARIVSICDVYSALRASRPQRPALSHEIAVQLMTDFSEGQFDPDLFRLFRDESPHIAKIFDGA
jgi:response regulator RpfG family c-di-GMP phosphodiesterase